MAKEKISAKQDLKPVMVFITGVTLTAGAANEVDFNTQITNAKPSGYKFHHIEYVGVYPEESWNSAVVGLIGSSDFEGFTKLLLDPITTQRYTVRAVAWYERE